MITLKKENLFKVEKAHGVQEDEIAALGQNLPAYLAALKERGQGFYQVIDDEKLIQQVEMFAAEKKDAYKTIVILGIGGSSLGAICIRQTLGPLFESGLNGGPELLVIDNIDPALVRELEERIDMARTLFVVITKSGSTPETLAQFFYFRQKCVATGLKIADHFVIITDPKNGFLRKVANEEGLTSFEVPPNVGGRFSVLTAVGLVPAALYGVDIQALMKGARDMRDIFLSADPAANMPFQIAAIQYLLYEKGKIMNVMTPYSQKLIRFADWYRQLLAESIGKTDSIGITPINALGVTDQHSQLQLYNEGPNDKLHLFLEVVSTPDEIAIPLPYPDESLSYLKNVTFKKLLDTEMEGTRQSLTQNNRPNFTITIDELNAENLGRLFLLFEGATALLGEMFGINAFDQPGVELSKKITKQLLSS